MSIPESATQTTLSFQQALDQAEVLARNALAPELHERLSCAVALVKGGAVLETDTPQTWTVASTSTPGKTYTVNGACPCPDAHYRAPHGRCKHRLAVLLARKTMLLMQQEAPRLDDVEEAAAPATDATVRIPQQFLQRINGKPFIKYAGLLQLAQAAGLVSLTAEWTYNDAGLSLARAVAVFQDGRRFEECGDATPENGSRVGLHWRRLASTRAKARCLRDALGIDLCSVEEME